MAAKNHSLCTTSIIVGSTGIYCLHALDTAWSRKIVKRQIFCMYLHFVFCMYKTIFKNWSKLSTDSTKKLPTWGRAGGCQKSRKNADIFYGWHLLWMVLKKHYFTCVSNTWKNPNRPYFREYFSGPTGVSRHVLYLNSSWVWQMSIDMQWHGIQSLSSCLLDQDWPPVCVTLKTRQLLGSQK